MLTPQQIADGWKPHDGGKQPTDDLAIIDYVCRNGARGHNLAECLFWHHDGRGDDIIAYREAGNAS